MNNDTITLFLATSILAIGGLGLYMFNADNKSSPKRRNRKEMNGGNTNTNIILEEEQDIEDQEEQQDQEDQEEQQDQEEPEEKEEYVSTRSRGSKTKKSRKQTKGTKRRY